MSKIDDVSKKLERIKYLFEDISEKCTKLIKYVYNQKYEEDSKIVKRLSDTCEIDSEQALSVVMSTVDLLSQDACDFLDQKDDFDLFKVDNDFLSFQFIAEIWNGDAYDSTECDALDEFRRDIEDQFKTLKNEEQLFTKCQQEYLKSIKRRIISY